MTANAHDHAGPDHAGPDHAGHSQDSFGINKPPPTAWAAVICMVVGLIVCAFAFILHQNIALWILGGVLGLAGVVLAKLSNIMEHSH
jgi:hypothetical protein